MSAHADADRIKAAIRAQTAGKWQVSKSKFLGAADRDYWLPSAAEMEALLLRSPVQHQGAHGEVFDCDDYCVIQKGRMSFAALNAEATFDARPIAFGVIWAHCSWMPDPKHAANWTMTDDLRLTFIEPQFNNAAARRAGHVPIRPPGDQVDAIEAIFF